MQWRLIITLGGVDKSSQLTGEVVVDGEEGSAVIAEFKLLPSPGPVNADRWIGAAVLIDAVVDGGTPERIFTGHVDVPQYDMESGLMTFRCTDGLQKRLEAMPRSEIDKIAGAKWSPYVFDDSADGWQYAQDRASVDYLSIEADRFGVIDERYLHHQAVHREYTDSDYLAGSLSVDLPSHRDLINRVELTIECRYTLFQTVTGSAGWSWRYKPGDAPGWPVPSPSAAQSAAQSAGHLQSFSYEEFPVSGLYEIGSWSPASAVDIQSGHYVLWNNERPAETCFSFSSGVAKRAPVEVTLRCHQVIHFIDSTSRYGVNQKDEVFALDLTAEPPAGWEQFQSDVEMPESFDAVDWLRPDMPVSFDPAVFEEVAAMVAQIHLVDVLKRHRARVRFAVPFDAVIDRSLGVRLDSTLVTASGKMFRFVHRLNTETGRAITELTLAPQICGSAPGEYLFGVYGELPEELPAKPDSYEVSVSFESRSPSDSGGVGFQVDVAAPDFSPVVYDYPELEHSESGFFEARINARAGELVLHGRSGS